MVKNTTGGNRHKSQARKFANPDKVSSKLRLVEEDGEEYAVVTKMLGNGMCHILTIRGSTMLCIIRGKFRGKRDNFIKAGSWVLIGTREWESERGSEPQLNAKGKPKLNQCDLLEVYSDMDKETLKTKVNANWHLLISNDSSSIVKQDGDETFAFVADDNREDYVALMDAHLKSKNSKTISLGPCEPVMEEGATENFEISIDDI